jgi:sec-independent protein translocase protein TatB
VLNLDPAKLLVIAVVAVILLGPDKLPQVARQVGAAWHAFGEFRHKMESEVRSSIPDLPSSADIARLARSPSALLDHLSSMDSPATGAAAATADAATADTTPTAEPSSPTPTSAGPPRNESSVTGVPITPSDAVSDPVPPTIVPPPTNPADPTLN